eukprot:TRINITY_DN22862_c0_g1_i1.p1 TRINITY_DN22862_c0_g1~~TRINITY_DN22862_c0_g1_i1.p1  ORF type:complete len:422 (+),score=102.84 TRINITY_DN22862_c0_g1_i1:138-1268(+)
MAFTNVPADIKNHPARRLHVMSGAGRPGGTLFGAHAATSFLPARKAPASSLPASLTITPHQLQQQFQQIRLVRTGRQPPDDDEREKKSGGNLGKLGAVAGLGSLLLAKGKYVLTALKLTKATPLISMVLTSLTYSVFFGLPYAVGMVGLIFVHECGHVMVMNHYGIKASPMVFVPFVGAAIFMKSIPETVEHEAMIAFGGPVLGSLGAVAVAGAAHSMDSQLLYALADFGLMINLFNLLPIGDMDGGRIGKAISPLVAVSGLGLGGLMIYQGVVQNPIFYIIMLAGTYSTGMRLFGYEVMPKGYYDIPLRTKTGISAAYVALVAALMFAMQQNNKRRKTPRQLKAEQAGVVLPDGNAHGGDGLYDDFFAEEEEWGQ